MSITAYALFGTFSALSAAVGAAACWVIGPRRPRFVAIPALAAFGTLYLTGHRLHLGFGPALPLFGFQVTIVSDVAFAVVAAAAGALAQRAIVVRREAATD